MQWTALYSAQIVMGWYAGYLTGQKQYQLAMAICAAGPALACIATIVMVRDVPVRGGFSGGQFRAALANFVSAARSPLVLCVGGFLLLWNFNPFAFTIQQLHITKVMNLGQEFFGFLESVQAVAAASGCLLYGVYCRRVPMLRLIHISIVLGIVSTVAFWFMRDKPSAIAVSAAVGFATATATMIQLDLAARIVPTAVAGTVFALLMSLANLGSGLSPGVGGTIYAWINPSRGPYATFNILVGIGAACTACCWFLVPGLRRLIQTAGSSATSGRSVGPPSPPTAG